MNISYNWLKKYINIDVTPNELSKILTSIGLEVGGVEEIQTIKGGLEGLVIGHVLTCVPHENSDHLHVTTVDIGENEPIQVVCGASNVAAGQKVVVATVGTKLYSGDDDFTIKRSKIRGVESFGMICAEDEIGIGKSHDGIIVLPEDAPVGMPAKEYYNVKSDYVIEVDITPNRADAISHYGVARDLIAYYSIRDKSIELAKPSVDNFKVESTKRTIPVKVENIKACPRYSALTVSGVRVQESPDWLKEQLQAVGLRPINNIVDATNYVMFELGQPLHAFDADRIQSGEVRVKNLPEATPFVTLDGVERKLGANDLMICDGDSPMCIGGVFGGLKSGVTEETTTVFLESAYFNPVTIRKTARFHGLNTDASFRYERGCDPDNTVFVLKRASLLIQEVAGGEISSEIIDVYPEKIEPFNVQLSLSKVYSLIGKNIGQETVETILKALEIKIESQNNGIYQLKVPAYRVDVQRDVDVIEDILRIYGYNNIEIDGSLKSTLNYASKPDSQHLQTLISEQLLGQGFNEVMNNSFTKSSYYTNLETLPEKACVRLLNPLSSDLNVMRQTLLFGGLENIARNVNRQHENLRFFEFGNCYFFNEEKKSSDAPLNAYKEEMRLALWLTGNKSEQSWALQEEKTSVYQLKGYVENTLRRLGLDLRNIVQGEYQDDLLREAISFNTRSGKKIGILGVVHPTVLKVTDVEQPVYYAEVYWTALLPELRKHKVLFREISKFPEVKRDLALLLDKNIAFTEIEKIAYESERNLLKEVYLFDVYEGKNLEAGKKSYAVSFILQDENKTLTDKQIDSIMNKIQTNLEKKLSAKLR